MLNAVAMLEAQRDELRAVVNMGAIEEFWRKDAECSERMAELDEVSAKREKCRQGFEALRKRRLDDFMAGFR